MTFARSHEEMVRAIADRIFTGAVLRVAHRERFLIERSYGTLGGVGTPGVFSDTLFDLASLTKVIATTTCWMILAARQPTILDRQLARWFPEAPPDKRTITPRLLLAHSSGLPAWRPYYLYGDLGSPEQLTLEHIFHEPLAYVPGEGWLYSDLGFVVLAAMVERETGRPLDACAREEVFQPLGVAEDLVFNPRENSDLIAKTRHDEPAGLVNDLNTRAMGGMSGHAGLFGTARSVTAVAEAILRSLDADESLFDSSVTRIFCARAGFVPGSTRTLGFDTRTAEGSSSGTYFSPESLGHTGFTGTSLWMDPRRDIIVTLLTNRVFMGEADNRIKAFRPMLHDAVMLDLG